MTLILGMDPFVFIAWIGTILAVIFCVIYGIYYEFFKKSESNIEKNESSKLEKKPKRRNN